MGLRFPRGRRAATVRELSRFAVLDLGGASAVSRMRPCGRALPVEHFSAVLPSLGHPAPCRLAGGIARELGHALAIRRVPEKFFRWVHRPVLLMVRLPCGETPPRARKAAASTGPGHAMSCAPSHRPMLRPSECTRLPAADTGPGTPWRFNLTRIPQPDSTRIGRKGSWGAGSHPALPWGAC